MGLNYFFFFWRPNPQLQISPKGQEVRSLFLYQHLWTREGGSRILGLPFFFFLRSIGYGHYFVSKVPVVLGSSFSLMHACVRIYFLSSHKLFFDVFLHVTFIFFVSSQTSHEQKNQDLCISMYIYGYICMFYTNNSFSRGGDKKKFNKNR